MFPGLMFLVAGVYMPARRSLNNATTVLRMKAARARKAGSDEVLSLSS